MSSKKQITKRSTQDVEKTTEAPKTRDVLVKFAKAALRKILLRPATWRFLVVHLPEVGAKVEEWLKDVIAFFSDLF
ncbi:hypothetical protein H3H36_24495 [Duganella sp. FT3S]|uniref:Uncharacterized protein n=1 Tax=Rugamonas fusca TaxID=2758568 RepID=A0A7W2I9F2_9BURK|nr:hypothetical protein [Rugamonas fusca]MBA5608510.1 hypothetical protein [Rugamonas fusca]